MGEISNFKSAPNPDTYVINNAIRKVATETKLSGVAVTNDLQHRGDSIHYDSPSARELGKRYAAIMTKQ